LNKLGQAVLCDPGLFGISLAAGSYKVVETKDAGDARYLAPELVKEDQKGYPTRATDVYALGWLGFEVRLTPCVMWWMAHSTLAHLRQKSLSVSRKQLIYAY
jgi:hypothetical protein